MAGSAARLNLCVGRDVSALRQGVALERRAGQGDECGRKKQDGERDAEFRDRPREPHHRGVYQRQSG